LFYKILVAKTLWTRSKVVFRANEFSYRTGGKWFAAQMNEPAFKNHDVASDAAPFIPSSYTQVSPPQP
jgi:hypothetical protein